MIFIAGNPVSSKNNKQIVGQSKKHGGKGLRLISSQKTLNYNKETQSIFNNQEYKSEFQTDFQKIDGIKLLGFHFVFKDNRRRDFHNFIQYPFDLLVNNGWIEDDNMNIIIGVPMFIDGKCFTVDKNNVGFYIQLFSKEEYKNYL